jgi:hypothetical protein
MFVSKRTIVVLGMFASLVMGYAAGGGSHAQAAEQPAFDRALAERLVRAVESLARTSEQRCR